MGEGTQARNGNNNLYGGHSKRPGKLKKVFRQGVNTVVRLATMGQSQSRNLTPLSAAPPHPDAPSLRFHPSCHGDNIRLEGDGARARRVESFCKGILFTDRPLHVGERVCIRLTDLSARWKGVLRIGFTSHDPDNLPLPLPKYACPDLTKKDGFWAKALSDTHSETNILLHFYFAGNGDVHFGVNGRDRGVFFSGIDTRQALWGMIDLYGNCTGIELIDLRRSLNNFERESNQQRHPHLEAAVPYEAAPPPQRHIQQRHFEDPRTVQHLNGQIATLSLRQQESVPHLPPPAYVAPPHPVPHPSHHPAAAADVLPLRYNHGVAFRPLAFHFCTGRHSQIGDNATVAWRAEEEFAQGYAFTAAPIRLAERMVVQVMQTENSYIGSLAFGLTNCDPSSIDTRDLPEDSDMLLDRPEYWVVSKDVGNSPAAGDELSFTIRPDGAVEFSKNGNIPSIFMHVDVSQRLWAFWDVYGNTSKIRLLGGTSVAVIRSNQVEPPPPPPLVNLAPEPPAAAAASALSEGGGADGDSSHVVPSECIVCLERPVDCVIYSCGHMCMCHGCAYRQWKGTGGGFCPICRESIRDVIKTFRS